MSQNTRTNRPAKRIRSAGGVLFEGHQVVLIAVNDGQRWQLPKGRIERGESPAQAAQREVYEETGVDGEILSPLKRIEFRYFQRGGTEVAKSIDYFLLHYVRGGVDGFDPREVSEARWFEWQEAIDILTFDNERNVLIQAHAVWRAEHQSPRST